MLRGFLPKFHHDLLSLMFSGETAFVSKIVKSKLEAGMDRNRGLTLTSSSVCKRGHNGRKVPRLQGLLWVGIGPQVNAGLTVCEGFFTRV